MIFQHEHRKRIATAALLCLLLTISACSHLPWQVLPTDIGIDQLCQQHRYVTALKALDARKRNTTDYEQKRAEILANAKSYLAELLQQADALIQQEQFAKAEVLIDTERAELPASVELSQYDEKFAAARDRYLQRWLDELVQARAPALAKEHIAYMALLKAAGTPELQRVVARHQADVEYFAPLIAKLGNQALSQSDYEKAAQYLAIANQLTPSATLEQQLKIAEQAIAAEKQKLQAVRINVREQRYRELKSVLKKSMRDHEFFAARDLLGQAKALNTHTDELDAMQRDLDKAIATFVAQQIDAGNRQYAEGHIEAALQNWRAANALTWTAELQDKIDKAQKFIDRLQQLRNTNH
ncbi:MAG TPA: hypothetical protein VFM32_04015 [Spongiibacteraceae bacterium]|nr:hypothetical protein [Spongiibacteraceae bacterium]